MKVRYKGTLRRFGLLVRSVPPLTFTLFVLSVFLMNLLANKSLSIPISWLALDCGIIVSWVAFLCMDILTRRFGPVAATELSVLAISINLCACLIMFAASRIPGVWGAFYDFGENDIVNGALDGTFGGTWYVVLGSTAAFVISAAVNNFTNFLIGKGCKKGGFGEYALRSYVSTAIGQFCDNLAFAFIVSHVFFGWSAVQCLTCAATGMVAELLLEAAFSPIGYRVCRRWENLGVGKEYLALVGNGDSAEYGKKADCKEGAAREERAGDIREGGEQ